MPTEWARVGQIFLHRRPHSHFQVNIQRICEVVRYLWEGLGSWEKGSATKNKKTDHTHPNEKIFKK